MPLTNDKDRSLSLMSKELWLLGPYNYRRMESDATKIEEVDQGDIILTENVIGYNIKIEGTYVGAIEGLPGRIEDFIVEPQYREKGVARAALNAFISLSRTHGASEVTTNNVMHPAMEHILETEGFQERSDEIGWVKKL